VAGQLEAGAAAGTAGQRDEGLGAGNLSYLEPLKR